MASDPVSDPEDEIEAPSAAQKRRRSEAVQRLQVGLSGIAAMLLLVSLVNILIDRARENQQAAVPESPASAPEDTASPANNDPLVDAGVVPPAARPSDGANAPPTAPN